jgi:hypothetical protein
MAVLAAILLPAFFCVQCVSEAVSPTVELGPLATGAADPAVARLRDLARTGHIEFLEHCLKNCRERYKDYRCTVTKQERIDGRVWAEQEIAVKFRESPFSVAMEWVRNPDLSDRALYVEGRYGNQMIVRPIPFLRPIWGQSFRRDPNAADVRQRTLRTVDQFGFERGLTALLDVYRLAKRNGELKEEMGPDANVQGRKAFVLFRILPERQEYQARRMIAYIDQEWLVPILVEARGWQGEEFLARYHYKDVKFNVGLTDEDFLPEKNELPMP